MTRKILLYLALLSVVPATSIYSQTPAAERAFINPLPIPQYYLNAVEKGTRNADGTPGPSYWQQFTDYSIKATFHPDRNYIDGSVYISYMNNSPDTLTTLHLDLDLNMHKSGAARIEPAMVTEAVTILGMSVQGQSLQEMNIGRARYQIDGTRLFVVPPRNVFPGESTLIEISFTLEMPQKGAGARVGHDSGNVFFAGYWYPRMTVYDDLIGWHPDTFLGRAEFYHGFGNYDIEISAPANWVVMCTGELLNPGQVLAPHVYQRYRKAAQSDTTVAIVTAEDFNYAATTGSPGDTLTWRFRAEMVRDVAFSATTESFWDGARASVGDRNADGEEEFITVHSFWRDRAPFWSRSVEYMQHSITHLSSYTGFAYPWPHMTAVEAGNIIGGGMEFPMMTLIGDYNTRGPDALYSVTYHEIAHMWIPMIISTDERRYSWFDEGYTVFHTDRGRIDFLGMDLREMTRQLYLRQALSGDEGEMMRWSDHHHSRDAFRIASYQKPAAILTALKGVLGAEVFGEIHREMFQQWAFNLMSPWDLFAFFESRSVRDLSWFWRSWYFETWVMDHGIEMVEETANVTIVHIRDYGDAIMPVFLTYMLSDGSEIEYKGSSVDVWLAGFRDKQIVLPHIGIQRIEIDQHRHFPDADRSNNIWER
jgi:hypothetical protein